MQERKQTTIWSWVTVAERMISCLEGNLSQWSVVWGGCGLGHSKHGFFCGSGKNMGSMCGGCVEYYYLEWRRLDKMTISLGYVREGMEMHNFGYKLLLKWINNVPSCNEYQFCPRICIAHWAHFKAVSSSGIRGRSLLRYQAKEWESLKADRQYPLRY